MTGSYEEAAISIALAAVHKHKQFKDIACYIKQQFDRKYPSSGKATEGVYHCVCGKRFASEDPVKRQKPPRAGTLLMYLPGLAAALSHETRSYIHLHIDTIHIILFKSKVSCPWPLQGEHSLLCALATIPSHAAGQPVFYS